MNKNNVLFIVKTAILLALLIALQVYTKPFGQIITGSSVNMILCIAILTFGLKSAIIIALLSPFFAFFLGVGPAFLPLTPCIALGNIIYVIVIAIICKRFHNKIILRNITGVLIASILKFIALYFMIVKGVCEFFIASLKPQQINTFVTMFSIPQLITAIIGGVVACIISPILNMALHSNKE